ncbi:MAG: transcriptional regulator [Solirubrobacterales bacterium]|nr:transcriptional regulator [Solirubrobacterales bacterium]
MAGKRSYADACGIARALDVVGERWALLVVRELLLGPKRFTDLRIGLPHIGPDVLAQRLRELERAGILRRRKLPPPAASQIYELTPRGRELEPVLLALGRWGSRAPFPATYGELSTDAFAVALKTTFDPAAAGDLSGDFVLRVGEDRLRAQVAEGTLEVDRKELLPHGDRRQPAGAEATISAAPGTLAALLWHGRELDEAVESGAVAIAGDGSLIQRFLSSFPLSGERAPVDAAVT